MSDDFLSYFDTLDEPQEATGGTAVSTPAYDPLSMFDSFDEEVETEDGSALLGGFQKVSRSARTDAQLAFYEEFDKAEDSISGMLGAVWEQPGGAWDVFVENLPSAGVSMAAGAAGAKAGAVAGGAVGAAAAGAGAVPGAVIGGIVGFAAGMFGGNALTEVGSALEAKAAEEGIITEEEAGEAALKGTIRTTAVTGVDLLTLGVTKWVGSAPGRAAEKIITKSLTDQGVDVTSDASIKAAGRANPEIIQNAIMAAKETIERSTGQTVRTTGLQAGVETLGEGVGEAAATAAVGDEVSLKEAALESLMGAPVSAMEIRIAKETARPGKMMTAITEAKKADDLRRTQVKAAEALKKKDHAELKRVTEEMASSVTELEADETFTLESEVEEIDMDKVMLPEEAQAEIAVTELQAAPEIVVDETTAPVTREGDIEITSDEEITLDTLPKDRDAKPEVTGIEVKEEVPQAEEIEIKAVEEPKVERPTTEGIEVQEIQPDEAKVAVPVMPAPEPVEVKPVTEYKSKGQYEMAARSAVSNTPANVTSRDGSAVQLPKKSLRAAMKGAPRRKVEAITQIDRIMTQATSVESKPVKGTPGVAVKHTYESQIVQDDVTYPVMVTVEETAGGVRRFADLRVKRQLPKVEPVAPLAPDQEAIMAAPTVEEEVEVAEEIELQPLSPEEATPADIKADAARREIEETEQAVETIRLQVGDQNIELADKKLLGKDTNRFIDEVVTGIMGKKVIPLDFSTAQARFQGAVMASAQPDTIFIDAEAKEPHMKILGHELLHTMAKDAPSIYGDLAAAIGPMLDMQVLRDYTAGINAQRRELGQPPMSPGKPMEEMIADVMGEGFLQTDFWARVHESNPAVFGRVIHAVKNFLDKAVELMSFRNVRSQKALTDVKKARDLAADAMAKYAEQRKEMTQLKDINFSTEFIVEETGEKVEVELNAMTQFKELRSRMDTLSAFMRCVSG